jgi:hypothetical protein
MKGDPFYYHKPTKGRQQSMERLRVAYRSLRAEVRTMSVGECQEAKREIALSITHMQESMNHAICALAISDPDAEVSE